MCTIKFNTAVKVSNIRHCRDCISFLYVLPCALEKDIAPYMSSFGDSLYDLDTAGLYKVNSTDGCKIYGRIMKVNVIFSAPKDMPTEYRKMEFENNLIKWLEDKVGVTIEI